MSLTKSETVANRKHGELRGFWPLIITQLQGAFNDNLYRALIVFYMVAAYGEGWQHGNLTMQLSALGAILFAVPYLVFPGIAGALADRYSKRTVTIATKLWEVMVMCVGVVAFYMGSPVLILLMLYMMFMQSAFFSPAKYGILPEILPEGKLPWGNGYLNMTTFAAIIAGTGVAGPLFHFVKKGHVSIAAASSILVVCSILGAVASFRVTKVPAADPARRLPLNPWSGLGKYFKRFYADRVLWLTMLGGGFFWFAGAVGQQNLYTYGLDTLKVSETWVGGLFAALMLGIGAGSLAAGYLSKGKIEMGLVPVGLAGMALTGFLLAIPLSPATFHHVGDIGMLGLAMALYLPSVSLWVALSLLFSLGFFAGFFEVPLMASLQHRIPADIKGGMIAAFNIVTCLGILLGGAAMLAAGRLGMNAHHMFLISAVFASVMVAYLAIALPVYVLRSGLWLLGNTIYRLRTVGGENIPQKGGALLIANHTSFIDALVLIASIDRPVRFIMAKEIYESRWVRPLAKLTEAIPISTMSTPKELVQSLRSATEAIQDGDLVCIFAEGQISRTGQMLPFRKGFEHIMKRVDAPIIPVHIGRLWGSIFSFADGKFFWKWPQRIPYPVTASFGEPLPNDTITPLIRLAIQELGTEAEDLGKKDHPMLQRAYVRTARKNPFKLAMADQRVPHMSYIKSLIATIVFARKLKKILGKEEMTGLLIPQSVGAALTNWAVMLTGRVPVNLNYTAAADSLASSARQCGITQVITSKEFLKRFPVEAPGDLVYLEDVKASVRSGDRIIATLLALFCPVLLLERLLGAPKGRSQDDLATVIFSSGSEGEPKGVMLTHHNISCNIAAPLQVFPHERHERFLGILPFFHSFGFTGTLCLPLTHGFGGVYHPNPLDAKAIGQLAYKYQPRFLVGTPTFLMSYIRRCLPEEFSSLDYVIAGAEKLPARIREAFKAKFGVEPLEGYGSTECAPIVSLNVPDFRAPGYYQVGTKHGTIGHPIPGVCVKVIDPDTGEPIFDGTSGLLLVKGPNVMKGYLHQPEKTAAVLKDGWYSTGDIASLDEDGFITITDRLSRFSKIGGEMVPHIKIEEGMHTILGVTEQVLGVTGVPDEAKGERLVVLHTLDDDQVKDLQERLPEMGLPNLWLPKPNAWYRIDEIPVLGTGKVAIRKLNALARELDLGE
jgi:acyl-[acyl-carrier-protein]-phospholipid O-acyltransferase / long-chain-fatty-acid--[acyl-carrier-protein] ligase